MDKIKENRTVFMVIGALVILAVIFFLATGSKDETPDTEPVISEETDNEGTSSDAANGDVPMPAESSWTATEVVNGSLTIDVPEEYFVSKPNVGEGCDVTSISTVRADGRPIAIATVYNVGCTHPDIISSGSYQMERNGYIFRAHASSPTALEIFYRIANSSR